MPESNNAGSSIGGAIDYAAYQDAQRRNLDAQTRKLNAEAEQIEAYTAEYVRRVNPK